MATTVRCGVKNVPVATKPVPIKCIKFLEKYANPVFLTCSIQIYNQSDTFSED